MWPGGGEKHRPPSHSVQELSPVVKPPRVGPKLVNDHAVPLGSHRSNGPMPTARDLAHGLGVGSKVTYREGLLLDCSPEQVDARHEPKAFKRWSSWAIDVLPTLDGPTSSNTRPSWPATLTSQP